jgi:hypothetical protein
MSALAGLHKQPSIVSGDFWSNPATFHRPDAAILSMMTMEAEREQLRRATRKQGALHQALASASVHVAVTGATAYPTAAALANGGIPPAVAAATAMPVAGLAGVSGGAEGNGMVMPAPGAAQHQQQQLAAKMAVTWGSALPLLYEPFDTHTSYMAPVDGPSRVQVERAQRAAPVLAGEDAYGEFVSLSMSASARMLPGGGRRRVAGGGTNGAADLYKHKFFQHGDYEHAILLPAMAGAAPS